jgi:hypothetical protein
LENIDGWPGAELLNAIRDSSRTGRFPHLLKAFMLLYFLSDYL